MQMELEKTSETSANASIGYLDGDGDLDVVLAKGRHWPLHNRILINDGHGGFSRDSRFAIPSESTTTIVAADFNSDRFWTSQILDMSLRFGRPHSLRRWKRGCLRNCLGRSQPGRQTRHCPRAKRRSERGLLEREYSSKLDFELVR